MIDYWDLTLLLTSKYIDTSITFFVPQRPSGHYTYLSIKKHKDSKDFDGMNGLKMGDLNYSDCCYCHEMSSRQKSCKEILGKQDLHVHLPLLIVQIT